MLKFKSWPPQPGEVLFTEQAKEALYGFRDNTDRGRIFGIGMACGNIIAANSDLLTTEQIGTELYNMVYDLQGTTIDRGVVPSDFSRGFQEGTLQNFTLWSEIISRENGVTR